MSSLLLSVCSCVSGGDAVRLILGVSEPQVFLSVRAVSQAEVEFRFSKPVTIASLYFIKPIAPLPKIFLPRLNAAPVRMLLLGRRSHFLSCAEYVREMSALLEMPLDC